MSGQTGTLLAVYSRKASERLLGSEGGKGRYPFQKLVSSGLLEVRALHAPTVDGFRGALEAFVPSFVYMQGEERPNEEALGSLVLGGVPFSTPEAVAGLFTVSTTLPTTVYLEIPNGEVFAEAVWSRGIPYIIYWNSSFSRYAVAHFRQALFSVVQSSCSHMWDAFQLAYASFQLHCVRNNRVLSSNGQNLCGNPGPRLLGESPKISVSFPEKDMGKEEGALDSLASVKVFDENVTMRFLICGISSTLDACLLGSLEDGLNAILNIEMRGSKLHIRTSAPPPPLQVGTISRGVVTMKCDMATSSSAHISLLVSGSAQTCFEDQVLEAHIKNEIIEKSHLVRALPDCEDKMGTWNMPRISSSVAFGASVYEVAMKVPTWASQVLRQLALEASYRSLAALGIASIQGLSVASFEEEDVERLLFFYTGRGTDHFESLLSCVPSWFKLPVASRKRPELCEKTELLALNSCCAHASDFHIVKKAKLMKERQTLPLLSGGQKVKVPSMRPVPHIRHRKLLPFCGVPEVEADAHHAKTNLLVPVVPAAKHSSTGSISISHRKSLSSSCQAQQIISSKPRPLKKHGCERCHIQVCPEEEFLKDVMEFLILQGHTRLVPQGGLAEFPDAILNSKRLDLYNLYREVVSRGGFHVGNGINWKGQVFSKMRNHTMANRMTGVGNALKRHYETYLLEYELAHDDVDGECCLVCHSSAAGDWVNCGMCGEWAHFSCDKRHGLGAFKDYAKKDGLEYVCPFCCAANFKKKQKLSNGYPQSAAVALQV